MAAGHLLLSVAIGAAVLAAMIVVWYPPPYFEATGGPGLVLLMIGVDVTLGPLLTTAVFNPAKGLGKLKLDLAVIGLLQLARLPDEPKLREESLFLAFGGVDLTQQPRFFVPYAGVASDAAREGREIAELKRLNPDRAATIDAIVRASGRPESGLRNLAAASRAGTRPLRGL